MTSATGGSFPLEEGLQSVAVGNSFGEVACMLLQGVEYLLADSTNLLVIDQEVPCVINFSAPACAVGAYPPHAEPTATPA